MTFVKKSVIASAATVSTGASVTAICGVAATHKQQNQGDDNQPNNGIIKKITQTVHFFIPPEFWSEIHLGISSLHHMQKETIGSCFWNYSSISSSQFRKKWSAEADPVNGRSVKAPHPSQ
jgi:hypothetical protein